MKGKTILAVGILFMALLFMATHLPSAMAKEASPKYGGTITISGTGAEKSFKPAAIQAAGYNNMILEQLVIGDITVPESKWKFFGNTLPEQYSRGHLAESWEIPDNATLIFHLRKGIHWQNKPPVNGREFVADDVVYSYKYYADPKNNSGMPIILGNLKSIKALDKYTVEFKFDPPTVDMWWGATGERQLIFAPEEQKQFGEMTDLMTRVGTGPWMIKEAVPGTSFTYVKNPDYWGTDPRFPGNRLPYADTVKHLIIRDPATQIAALRVGKIDAIWQRPWVTWNKAEEIMKTNPELKHRQIFFQRMVYYALKNDVAPFSDIRVRKALSMAIDRQAIVNDYYKGHAYMGTVPFTNGWNDLFTPVEKLPEAIRELYDFNPEKAKKLLAEAGYPQGFKCELDVPSLDQDYQNIAQLTKGWLADIGVDVKINVLERGPFVSALLRHNYKNMISWHMGTDTPLLAISNFRDIGGKPNMYNWCRVNDPAYNQMVDKIAQTFDYDSRTKLLKEIDLYIKSQVWEISMPLSSFYIFWQPWIEGYWGQVGLSFVSSGDMYKYWWIDQDLKSKMGK